MPVWFIRLVLLYACLSAITVTTGILLKQRLSMIIAVPAIATLCLVCLALPQVRALIRRLLGTPEQQAAAAAVAGVGMYVIWRLVTAQLGW